MSGADLIFFLLIGIGWIISGIMFFIKIKKIIEKEIEKEKRGLFSLRDLAIDIIIFCLVTYGYYIGFFQSVIFDTSSTLLFYFLILICFGILGYICPSVQTFFRYGVLFMTIYGAVFFSIFAYIFNRGAPLEIVRQIWDIYKWFLFVLFPFEIGNLIRKIKLIIKF